MTLGDESMGVPETERRRTQAEEFMRQGQFAFLRGDREVAHSLWQRAAYLTPKDEKIWLALLKVLDNDSDRIICLENILKLNPNNEDAAEQLQTIKHRSPARARALASKKRPLSPWRKTVRSLIRTITSILIVLLMFVVGIVIGVLLNLL